MTHEKKNLSWLGLLATFAAVGLGGYGALVAQPAKDVTWMVLAFVAAAVLLALGAGLPSREPDPSGKREIRWHWRAALGFGGLLVSGVLIYLALERFTMPPAEHGTAWIFFWAGIACLLGSWLPWGGSREWPTAPITRGELFAWFWSWGWRLRSGFTC